MIASGRGALKLHLPFISSTRFELVRFSKLALPPVLHQTLRVSPIHFELRQRCVSSSSLASENLSMAKEPVKYSVVDAFTESAFKGNPAAVCLLDEERDRQWKQAVAAEFNISETCFLNKISDSRFTIRFFTPLTEVDLCGHATLAASHAVFSSGLVDSDVIEFETLAGVLTVKKIPAKSVNNGETDDGFYMEFGFPADHPVELNSPEISQVSAALNVKAASIVEVKKTKNTDDIFVVLESGAAVKEVQPQIDEIVKYPGRGLIVTGSAPSESGFDFFSRFFSPKLGINEDPVCGSAHCSLATYWSKKLQKCDFNAYQASSRGGVLKIHLDEQNQRVLLRGKAVTVMEGSILV
ncbi:uncharacterized protein LOC130936612 isoform X2 [Arachis stenosperma]|uniref:uncharacterized protein LOC130936612 isoform X2 n=1 Tax=Arachis stenosperma TaxID=217475 RepID=UPI0025ABE283|nr:uncharacterized protein LOC130936612 isoform X2 [Arachis stenosperma]